MRSMRVRLIIFGAPDVDVIVDGVGNVRQVVKLGFSIGPRVVVYVAIADVQIFACDGVEVEVGTVDDSRIERDDSDSDVVPFDTNFGSQIVADEEECIVILQQHGVGMGIQNLLQGFGLSGKGYFVRCDFHEIAGMDTRDFSHERKYPRLLL